MNRVALALSATLLMPAVAWAQDGWMPTTPEGAPQDRFGHTAVWTGQVMILWGGGGNHLNTGATYDPAIDSWSATNLTGAPQGRSSFTAVWTGKEMIVWGGHNGSTPINTGGRYDPQLDSWTPTSLAGAPTGRSKLSAVWTGKELIVWGGYATVSGASACQPAVITNTGGRYDPETDTWTTISTVGAPSARARHAAVWTGTEMIVWGGDGNAGSDLTTGGRYDPETDTWIPMTSVGSPFGEAAEAAVWTGAEMIVWGASVGVISGGRYSPELDTWTPLPTAGALSSRYGHTAVWTGQEMIVWGGADGGYAADGAKYSPQTDTWVPTSMEGVPPGRHSHTAVWTGSRMIVWGGTKNNGWEYQTGGVYGGDATAPVAGHVAIRAESTSISATWSGFEDPETGVAHYEWSIGTSPGAADVLPLTDVGSSTAASTEFVLEPGKLYYVTVRATSGEGRTVTSTSDGAFVAGHSTPARGCSAAATYPKSLLGALGLLVLIAAYAAGVRSARA